VKRIISIVVSLGILAALYAKIDLSKIVPVFTGCSVPWLAASLLMVVPLTLLTSGRLCQLMPKGHRVC